MNEQNPLDRLTGAQRAMSEVRKPEPTPKPQEQPKEVREAPPAPAARSPARKR